MAATAAAAAAAATTVVVASVEDVDRIYKLVDLIGEAHRREAEPPKVCQKCGGTAEYVIDYDKNVMAGPVKTARVCESCMEDNVVSVNGKEIHMWKQNAIKVSCALCGDDVTDRGWCVCPRNARLARGNGGAGSSTGTAAAAAREAGVR